MKTLEDVLEEIRPAPDPDFVADMERRMQLGFPPRAGSAACRESTSAAAAADGRRGRGERAAGAARHASSVSGGGDESDRPAGRAHRRRRSSSGGRRFRQRRDIAPISTRRRRRSSRCPTAAEDFAPGAEVRRIERSAAAHARGGPGRLRRPRRRDLPDRRPARRLRPAARPSLRARRTSAAARSSCASRPAELQPTLNDLSRLATVRARGESGTDVTGSFVSIRDRLRTARALRTSLLRRLELAVTDTAERALRRRLEIVGNRITALRAQFRDIRERTEYATVFVDARRRGRRRGHGRDRRGGRRRRRVARGHPQLPDPRGRRSCVPARARRAGSAGCCRRAACDGAHASARWPRLLRSLPQGSDTVELLSQVPLFAGLAPDDVAQLADVAVPRRWSAGEVVFREGDEGDTCYVVRSGAARVTRNHSDGRAITLAELRRGDIFGELAMWGGETRSATVEALEDTTAVALLAGDVRRLLAARPEIAVKLLERAGRAPARGQRADHAPVVPDRRRAGSRPCSSGRSRRDPRGRRRARRRDLRHPGGHRPARRVVARVGVALPGDARARRSRLDRTREGDGP